MGNQRTVPEKYYSHNVVVKNVPRSIGLHMQNGQLQKKNITTKSISYALSACTMNAKSL